MGVETEEEKSKRFCESLRSQIADEQKEIESLISEITEDKLKTVNESNHIVILSKLKQFKFFLKQFKH